MPIFAKNINLMKKLYILTAIAALFSVATSNAQVTINAATPKTEATFSDRVKTETVKVAY